LWFPREEFLRSAETRRKEEQDRLTVLVTMKHGISTISTGFYPTKPLDFARNWDQVGPRGSRVGQPPEKSTGPRSVAAAS